MADTTSVKKHVDYAQQQIDEQAIADKFNAATAAQYAVQRDQNRQAENQFYNQMYNTQQTAMDTIRKSNAAAVSTGASRGVQAANELSAILGLEKESVAGATELAQANRQTAQEETAAVLENVLKAYQQAVSERQQLVQQGIEAASVDVQQDANEVQRENIAVEKDRLALEERRLDEVEKTQAATQSAQQKSDELANLTAIAQNGTSAYLTALASSGKDYATTPTLEGYNSLSTALSGMDKDVGGSGEEIFVADDWAGWDASGKGKAKSVETYIKQVCKTYGLTYEGTIIESKVNELIKDASDENVSWINEGKANQAADSNALYRLVLSTVKNEYLKKLKATE
jgi:hypothetical protein